MPDVIVSGDGGGVTEQGRPAQWYDEGVIIEVDVNGVVTEVSELNNVKTIR